jgi:hypothetical protein
MHSSSLKIILPVLFSACIGCGPKASFTTDKTVYDAGESVRLMNTSRNAVRFRWFETDSLFSTEREPVINLPERVSGERNIRLEAISRNGNYAECSRSFSTTVPSGTLSVWSSVYNFTQVYAIGKHVNYIGSITRSYPSYPGCFAEGCVTIRLFCDTYSITAGSGTAAINGTVAVTRDACASYCLK